MNHSFPNTQVFLEAFQARAKDLEEQDQPAMCSMRWCDCSFMYSQTQFCDLVDTTKTVSNVVEFEMKFDFSFALFPGATTIGWNGTRQLHWWGKKNMRILTSNSAKESASFAHRFQPGHFCFCGPAAGCTWWAMNPNGPTELLWWKWHGFWKVLVLFFLKLVLAWISTFTQEISRALGDWQRVTTTDDAYSEDIDPISFLSSETRESPGDEAIPSAKGSAVLKERSMYLCFGFDLPRNDSSSKVRHALEDHIEVRSALGVVSIESERLRVFEHSCTIKNHQLMKDSGETLQERSSLKFSKSTRRRHTADWMAWISEIDSSNSIGVLNIWKVDYWPVFKWLRLLIGVLNIWKVDYWPVFKWLRLLRCGNCKWTQQ